MDYTNRLNPGPAPGPDVAARAGDALNSSLAVAAVWAHSLGGRLARGRNWVENEGMEKHTFATLGAAFGLGVMLGWLIKRR